MGLSIWFAKLMYRGLVMAKGEFQAKYRVGCFLNHIRERDKIPDHVFEALKQEFRDNGIGFTEHV